MKRITRSQQKSNEKMRHKRDVEKLTTLCQMSQYYVNLQFGR